MAKLYDNYGVADEKILLYTHIRNAFDRNREELSGVDEQVLFADVMKHSKGRFNPVVVKQALKEFKR